MHPEGAGPVCSQVLHVSRCCELMFVVSLLSLLMSEICLIPCYGEFCYLWGSVT